MLVIPRRRTTRRRLHNGFCHLHVRVSFGIFGQRDQRTICPVLGMACKEENATARNPHSVLSIS